MIFYQCYCLHIKLFTLKTPPYYFLNALELYLYFKFDIVCVRFDKMEKRLISSYDEINDTFVGKVDGENGYVVDYGIGNGIFLRINNSNLPTSVFIPNASEVLDVSKSMLESSDVKIGIMCDEVNLTFILCIENLLVYSTECKNDFGIPNLNCVIDCNV